MKQLRWALAAVGHAVALLIAVVIGADTTPWLLRKLREEDEQVGRLI